MVGEAAQVAEFEEGSMASAVLRGLAERTAARELLRAQEYEEDREWIREGDAYFARFQEGYLCKLMSSESWTLFLVWPDRSTRVLIRGRRKAIERYAQEVLSYGPPGGPDYQGGALKWRGSDGDETLRAATIGGELRLMPWQGGQHLLLLVQNDYGVAVLGRGLREVLLRTAERLLDARSADTLHLRVGDERINLHGLGSASVVGYVDLQQGGLFVLGPVEGGDFGLYYQLGESTRTVGVYTLGQVRRGDLGRTFAWCSNAASARQSVVDIPQASGVAAVAQFEVTPAQALPAVEDPTPSPEVFRGTPEVAEPTPEAARPRRPADGVQPSGPAPMPPHDDATSQQPRVAARMPPVEISPPVPDIPPSISDQDLRLVERHLTLDEEATGGGATAVPRLLTGVYRMVALGLADQLLRAEVFRTLLAKRFGIHFDCGARTFRRALLAVAAHTPLLRKVGHRWYVGSGALQRPDSELMVWIRAVTPPGSDLEDASGENGFNMDRGAVDDPAASQVPVEPWGDDDPPPATSARAAHPVPEEVVDRTGGHDGASVPTPVTDEGGHPKATVERVADPDVLAPQASADQAATAPPATPDRIADGERVAGPGSAEPIDNGSVHPRHEDAEPDRHAYAAAAAPAPTGGTTGPPRWGYQRRLRTDGKPTVWQRRWEPLPAEQSATRFPGKKGRDPRRR